MFYEGLKDESVPGLTNRVSDFICVYLRNCLRLNSFLLMTDVFPV